MTVVSRPAKSHPSYHMVTECRCGVYRTYAAFMDDFGTLVRVDYNKLAILIDS